MSSYKIIFPLVFHGLNRWSIDSVELAGEKNRLQYLSEVPVSVIVAYVKPEIHSSTCLGDITDFGNTQRNSKFQSNRGW